MCETLSKQILLEFGTTQNHNNRGVVIINNVVC